MCKPHQPKLKLNHSLLPTSSVIQEAYDKIKAYKLCWLAHEELEETYRSCEINENIRFNMRSGHIEFVCRLTGRQLALICFDESLVTIPNTGFSIAETYQRSINDSNRQPIARQRKPLIKTTA